ncbi:MAG TPA: tetratricopeptide repeat protein [Streptosporangiaceae bacterium]|jgi:tetratricopeptide (TPR) repeat protein
MTTFMGDAEFAGDAVAGNKIVQLAAPPLAEPPRQLPLDVPDFTGRRDAIAKLDALVDVRKSDSSSMIVTITGMPGVGKTALAVHWSHRMAGRFQDGHLFIDLRGYSERAALSPVEALGQALRALGVPGPRIPADPDEAAALYRTQLAVREMLVVLDDAASSRQVQPLIPGNSSCLVVVTSRTDLGGLVARAGARTVPLDVLPATEALDLVRAVAGRERTEAEPEAAKELIQLCARLPLALRIAAANLAIRPQQSVADTVRALSHGDRLSRLAIGEDLAGAVGATFGLSYRGLSDELRRAFRLVGLIDGPTFTSDATGALLAVTPEAGGQLLRRLEEANLLQAVRHDRYRLHELLREYARQRAADADDPLVQEAALQRFATWYLSTAQQAGRFLDRYRRTIRQELTEPPPENVDPVERKEHMNWFALERANLIAVIRQAARYGWDQLTWELADAVYDFLELRRHSIDNLEVHRLGLEAAEHEHQHLAQFFMRHHLAASHRELGQYQLAFAEAERAYDISKRIQDRYGEASALDNLARIDYHIGEYKEALNTAQQALRIRRDIGDRHGQAATLDTLSVVHRRLSQYQDAWNQADAALVIHRDIGDLRGEGETLDNLARIYKGWGRHHQALDYAERALAIRRTFGDRHGESETLALLGTLHLWLGRFPLAQEYVDGALKICREIADRHGEGRALEHLSVIRRRLGQYKQAVRLALEALDTLQELGDPYGEAQALIAVSRAQRRIGLHRESIKDAERALSICRKIGDRSNEGVVLDALAGAHRKLGNTRLALELGENSLAILREIGDRRGQGLALDTLCKVHLRRGEHGLALQFAREALAVEAEVQDDYGRSVTLNAMGRIHADLRQYEEALACMNRALTLKRELGDVHGVTITFRRLAELFLARGRREEARAYAERAKALEDENGFAPPDPVDFEG